MEEKLRIFLSLLNGNDFDVNLAVHYGSRVKGKDTDVLLISNEEPINNIVAFGALDISIFSLENANHLIGNFDPLITEPILTGDLIAGDAKLLESMRASLQKRCLAGNIVRYFSERAFLSLGYAQSCLNGSGKRSLLRQGVVNLSFALSYLLFGQHYFKNGGPAISKDHLISNISKDMKILWNKTVSLKNNPDISEDLLSALIGTIYDTLLRSFSGKHIQLEN